MKDQQVDNEDSADDDDEEMNDTNEQLVAKRTKHEDTDNKRDNDLLEPKNEYDEDNENVEDLTLDDEELLDDLDQAGPSHGGEGSSQGKQLKLKLRLLLDVIETCSLITITKKFILNIKKS